jgi:hypothetical protein
VWGEKRALTSDGFLAEWFRRNIPFGGTAPLYSTSTKQHLKWNEAAPFHQTLEPHDT